MRPARLALTAAGLVALATFAGTAMAQTTTKSSSTNSCPSQQSVMTSNWYGSTSGYLCAQEYHDGNQNIGAGDSETFSQDTNVAYFPQYYCWDSSDDKDVTYAHAEIFGSGSVTATNWGTGSHVWGAGYLYTLGSGSVTGWTNGCYDNAAVWQNTPSIMTLSSISASGLPDNGASAAGTPYSVTVQVNPASAAVGQMAALQDNGVSVAAGAIQSDGSAKFTWTPALMGSRKIQVAWPGTTSALGNLTDAYTVDVSGGTGVSITPDTFTYSGSQIMANVTVNIDTSPNPMPAELPVVLVDTSTANPSATPPVPPTQLSPTPVAAGQTPNKPLVATPTSTGSTKGSVQISFPATAGKTYKLVAQVPNSASTQADPLPALGQSYATALPAPVTSSTSSTFPSKVYVGTQPTWSTCSLVPVATTISPSGATGTVTPADTGSPAATVTNSSATAQWCPPSTPGTYTPVVNYSGDNGRMPSSSPGTSSVQVVSGGPVGSGITLSGYSSPNYSTAHANGTLTVSGGWSGTASIYDSAHSWKLVGTGTITNGSGVISIAFLTAQTMNLVPKFTIDGTQYFQGNMKQWFVSSNISGGYELHSNERGEMARTPGRRSGTRGAAGAPASLAALATGAQSVSASRRVTTTARSITLKCPKGYFPLESQGSGSGPAADFGVSVQGRTVKVTSPSANVGSRMSARSTCRAQGAIALVVAGKKAYGTAGADHFALSARNAVVLAGPGKDRVALTGAGAVAWGGFGDDHIAARGADSVAGGGPGRDRLVALGSQRVLLLGGPGPDTLVGNLGPALLNARDGRGGDRVLCRSSRNRAMVDPGDRVVGPCSIEG